MAGLTQTDITNFVKPNYYVLQNVLTFLLPGRKEQFDFYNNLLKRIRSKLDAGAKNAKVQQMIEWESSHLENLFVAYLLSEEMGTYFMAMANHPEGDIISTVLSKKSYEFAHNFYQLSKYESRGFFSKLMIYPNTPELRAISDMPNDTETVELFNKAFNVSCSYLWEKKERIRQFRDKYKSAFNSYKHGMSILYNMRADINVKTKNGHELSGFSVSPVILNIRSDKNRTAITEQWQQLPGFKTIEKDVTETFGLIYYLFKDVVTSRLNFIYNLLQAHKYDLASESYLPFKPVKLFIRLFDVSKLSEKDINELQEKFGFILDG